MDTCVWIYQCGWCVSFVPFLIFHSSIKSYILISFERKGKNGKILNHMFTFSLLYHPLCISTLPPISYSPKTRSFLLPEYHLKPPGPTIWETKIYTDLSNISYGKYWSKQAGAVLPITLNRHNHQNKKNN